MKLLELFPFFSLHAVMKVMMVNGHAQTTSTLHAGIIPHENIHASSEDKK